MTTESEPSFKLRRSDIIAICGALLIFAGQIVSYTIMSEKVNVCVEWQKTNSKLPACVEANTNWILDNKYISDKVLTSELKVEFLQNSIDRLSEQIEIATKNFTQLNQRLSKGLIQ